ncbi:MAG: YggS family pyridoxal phosphate-dependent enzyme [Candidatus Nanopelagicales bacterium]
MTDSRTEEIAAAFGRLRERIGQACAAVGRTADDVHIIAVTKTYPAEDVARLARLGIRDIGENRDQEAARKVQALQDLKNVQDHPVRWHFVGRLQTNKARSVARYADVVHSVDRVDLVTALARGAENAGRSLDCLLQLSLDPQPGRGGVAAAELEPLAEQMLGTERLRLRGVMAVAPLDADPDEAFARLADIAAGLRAVYPQATWISAGMSADLESAIRHGATHVRVGAALLGRRSRLR